VINNLSGDEKYVVKICAGTKSLSNPNKTWLGEPSEERIVYLPEDKYMKYLYRYKFKKPKVQALNSKLIVNNAIDPQKGL